MDVQQYQTHQPFAKVLHRQNNVGLIKLKAPTHREIGVSEKHLLTVCVTIFHNVSGALNLN